MMFHPFLAGAREILVICICAYGFTFHCYQLSGENKDKNIIQSTGLTTKKNPTKKTVFEDHLNVLLAQK